LGTRELPALQVDFWASKVA